MSALCVATTTIRPALASFRSFFRMESDLLNIIEAVVDNKLDKIKIKWSEDTACCVVMASEGYPGEYVKGREIKGIDKISDSDVFVFHLSSFRRSA